MKHFTNSSDQQKWHIPALLVGVLVFYSVIAWMGAIRFSDPILYTEYAYQMFYDFDKVMNSESVFANRVGHTFLIMSGIIPFGINLFGASFFLILVSLYTAYRLSLIIQPQGADKLLYVLLFFFNPIMMQCMDLAVDLTANAFFLLSLFALLGDFRNKYFQIITSIFFLTWAFLAKESMLIYCPIIFFSLWAKKNFQFSLKTSALVVLSAFAIFLIFMKITTGDYLFRIHIIETEHNISVWSYENETLYDKTIFRWKGIPSFLFINYPIIILNIIALIFKLWQRKNKRIDFKNYIGTLGLLYVLFVNIFISTSLKEYNPLPLATRMWSLLLPFSIWSLFEMRHIIKSERKVFLFTTIVFLIVSLLLFWQGRLTKLNLIYIFFTLLLIALFTNTERLNGVLRTSTLAFLIFGFIALHLKINWINNNELKVITEILKNRKNGERIYSLHSRVTENFFINKLCKDKNIQLIQVNDKDSILPDRNYLLQMHLLEFECITYKTHCDKLMYFSNKNLPPFKFVLYETKDQWVSPN